MGILGLFSGILQCGLMAQDQASDPWSNSPRDQIKTGQVCSSLMIFLNPKGHLQTLGALIHRETSIPGPMKSLSSTNISDKYSVIATKKRQAFGTVNVMGLKLQFNDISQMFPETSFQQSGWT